jgi:DNA-binding transcriptional LysR family regulator
MGRNFNDRTTLRKAECEFDLKHLRYAVAAADHGSFRRAAEVRRIKQSTLSRSILQLERATSTPIFNRSRGGVVVSALGRDFIRMARVVLEQIDEFGSSALSPLRQGLLSVGFCTSLSAGGLRSNLLEFHRRFPQFRLSTLERRRSRLATKLQNGTLDIAISTGRLPTAKCKAQALWSERVLIALPEDHRLVDRDTIYWTDLRSETLLMSQYDPYREFEDLVTSKLVSYDDRPRIERHDVSQSILKSLVSMKLGLGLMLESDVGVLVPSIVFKELRDGTGAACVEFSAFWHEANENPALVQFLRLLKERYPILPRDDWR